MSPSMNSHYDTPAYSVLRWKAIVKQQFKYVSKTNNNNADNIRIMYHWGAFAKHCCCWNAVNITYFFVCDMRACMWVPGRVGACMRMRACSLANPTCNDYAPYCDVICGPSVTTTFLTLSHKLFNFRKNVIKHKMCFDLMYNFYLRHFSFYEGFSEI
jgi:hypothetical protein